MDGYNYVVKHKKKNESLILILPKDNKKSYRRFFFFLHQFQGKKKIVGRILDDKIVLESIFLKNQFM